jgi:hypothetical protein
MALGLLGLLGFVGKRRAWALAAVAALWVILWASCGGGGGSIVSGEDPGTPAGTYELTVTVSDGTLTHTTMLSLTVQ